MPCDVLEHFSSQQPVVERVVFLARHPDSQRAAAPVTQVRTFHEVARYPPEDRLLPGLQRHNLLQQQIAYVTNSWHNAKGRSHILGQHSLPAMPGTRTARTYSAARSVASPVTATAMPPQVMQSLRRHAATTVQAQRRDAEAVALSRAASIRTAVRSDRRAYTANLARYSVSVRCLTSRIVLDGAWCEYVWTLIGGV